MASPICVTFVGGDNGVWGVERVAPVIGESLQTPLRLAVHEGNTVPNLTNCKWLLRGTTSNTRYTHRVEVDQLAARQQGLQRPEATRAALIPIRKSAAWWALAQDERRAIFEEQSKHIAIGMEYLPPIARRLHHCREFSEPFDFLTWFEYAPEYSDAFEEMVRRLRETREWQFVDREVDIRLSRL